VNLPMTATAPDAPNGAGGRPMKQLRSAQVECVRRNVAAASKADRTISYTELYKLVAADRPNQELPSIDSFRRHLKKDHNIRFLRTGMVVPRANRIANTAGLQAEFVLRLSEAYDEEAAERGVVVWYDESYCHTHHKRSGSVVDMLDPKQYVKRRRAAPAAATHVSSGGTLFIVLHAATKDGLLVTRDSEGKPIKVAEDNNRSAPTAEWIYRANRNVTDSDYHAHITCDAICQWLQRRLFPAVRALYPGRRVWLVCDNAAVHKAMPSDWLNPKSASKKAITAFLFERGIRTMAVRNANGAVVKRFHHSVWEKAAPKGPSKKQVQEYLSRYYDERPGTVLTRVQEILRSEVYH
jgi:hypothetical protein